jgi:hypothetical protein
LLEAIMANIQATDSMIRAAAQDTANKQMRSAGRTQWNMEDLKLAAAEYGRLTEQRWASQPLGGGVYRTAE